MLMKTKIYVLFSKICRTQNIVSKLSVGDTVSIVMFLHFRHLSETHSHSNPYLTEWQVMLLPLEKVDVAGGK